MTVRWTRLALLAALMSLAVSSRAQAESVLLGTFAGSDCAGLFGDSFTACAIPDDFDPDNSPVIIKFNANGSVNEINSSLFPTISGDEFSFTFGSDGTGTWTYTPDADDPFTLVSFFVAKAGSSFNLFGVDSNGPNSWFTPTGPNGQPLGLSHLTFYEGASDAVVPEPATMLLVGSGLLAARRWRRKQQVQLTPVA
ncbi:MAG TPA: PEP-CTERM sorting domain-containing protein [Vicinamibacterales bacterium]|nr:PEP-CTERM sorting domain-containing protein [Vicinamibacterales bacterium]